MGSKIFFVVLIGFAFLFYGIGVGLGGWQLWKFGTAITWLHTLFILAILSVAGLLHFFVLEIGHKA